MFGSVVGADVEAVAGRTLTHPLGNAGTRSSSASSRHGWSLLLVAGLQLSAQVLPAKESRRYSSGSASLGLRKRLNDRLQCFQNSAEGLLISLWSLWSSSGETKIHGEQPTRGCGNFIYCGGFEEKLLFLAFEEALNMFELFYRQFNFIFFQRVCWRAFILMIIMTIIYMTHSFFYIEGLNK